MLGGKKRGRQVNRKGVLEASLRDTGAGTSLAEDASVVESDVEPTEIADSGGDERPVIVFRADISCNGYRKAAS